MTLNGPPPALSPTQFRISLPFAVTRPTGYRVR